MVSGLEKLILVPGGRLYYNSWIGSLVINFLKFCLLASFRTELEFRVRALPSHSLHTLGRLLPFLFMGLPLVAQPFSSAATSREAL